MRIGILEAGPLPDDLQPRHGRYADLFRELLAGHGFAFEAWRVYDHELPPDIDAAEGWIITGSRHAVYEDHAWLPPLRDLARAAHARRRPLAGICFGHQLLADALGGKVEKSDRGWGIGVHAWETEAGPLRLLAAHQDQVTAVPPGARVTAASAFCPVAALEWPDAPLLAWQGHPEFTPEFGRELIAARRGEVYPEPLAEVALASLSTPLDRQAVADRMAALFRSGG